jgi:trans-aconitate 2-methyltransferase
MTTRDWDAVAYDRLSNPQVAMAGPVLDRLPLNGDEIVLDAGCGSGRVTELLLERLPAGRVIGVDAAASMLEQARVRLAGRPVELIRADLAQLELPRPVDAVFSNAVFHWVPDHDALFRALFTALRPGGRLVAQCGGKGNIERFHALACEVGDTDPFAPYLAGWTRPQNFADVEETEQRLRGAGFESIEVWLEPLPVVPDSTEDYLRSVCLGPLVQRLPEELRDAYVKAVAERCGEPAELDYIRLNIVARRPA